ncbi:rhodanese-like domain-containing protein [Rivularia sp. UHCC 0363]|uniref:rhodanese-like domain-containing protein n=1 Tax=Rivularia sp. UHCC 0363 TaxID=3110244 RepID=UPI002B20719A|nr:rhodanese-like domain-containing protein [Rivularia sp. UHCC 0363]MEA5599180.1 rhodanese-like domain-containing protein [Rivularia sp. UHCC 0363]
MSSVSSSRSDLVDLSPEDFVQSAEPLHLIDVRSRFEYNQFHAPDAINLSLPRILLGQVPILRNWALPQWLAQLPKETPIALICLTAHRSPVAAQTLSQMGFSQVFNITGGMMAWKKAGLPTQAGRP